MTKAEEREVRRLAFLEFGADFPVELTNHESLPHTAAGKLRLFVSEPSGSAGQCVTAGLGAASSISRPHRPDECKCA